MDHPAFGNAGQAEGVEIWTIEKFEPVPVEPKMYGKFYNGDSYIVLNTQQSSGSAFSYNAHFWLGTQSTQDKIGAAAILTVTLDNMLGGRAVQHREVQGHESGAFLGYFRPAIRYLEGGNESGFNEVETNAGAEKRLLRLSGCDNMRIDEVPAEFSSLAKDLCFILEQDHSIFVLIAEGAKATQRTKIISIATRIRDEEHNGRGSIEIIDEFSSSEDWQLFFEVLGSGGVDELADGSDTTESYARNETAVLLFKVAIGDELELEALSKPYKQKQLTSDHMYILDTPDSGVFIWIGLAVDADVKKNYHGTVQQYLELKEYPSWVHATRVAEGAESNLFKQYFTNWDNIDSSIVRTFAAEIDAGYSSDAESEVHARLVGKSAAASGYMPDNGSGGLAVVRFTSAEPEDLTEKLQSNDVPVLYHSEVYVVKYQYTDESGEDAFVLYKWVGSDASGDDKAAATEMISNLEQELEGNTIVVKVPQGKEPKHFLGLFKGKLVILFGSKGNDYAPDNYDHNYEDNNVRLFRVEGTELGVDMRAVQVAETPDVLEDDDVFVLETKEVAYVRLGKESDPKEHEAALELINSLVKEHDVVTFQQGEEPPEFWDALGGPADDKEDNSGWRNTINRRVNAARILTAVTVKLNGAMRFEEIDNYCQQDLADDGAYILDTGEELYLWKGSKLPERVRAVKDTIIEEYIDDDGLDRTADTVVVVTVKQGSEPAVFKRLFKNWDDNMWNDQDDYENIKMEIKSGSH